MVRWLVAKRGVTPNAAPNCKASEDASAIRFLSGDSSISWRRQAAMYKPTLPSSFKPSSKPSSVLPSLINAIIKSRPSFNKVDLMFSPIPATLALFSCMKYRFSNSVLISTKVERIQVSKFLTFGVIKKRAFLVYINVQKKPRLSSWPGVRMNSKLVNYCVYASIVKSGPAVAITDGFFLLPVTLSFNLSKI